MKILYLHQYFKLPDSSGSSRAYQTAKRLSKSGYDVTVITASSGFSNHYELDKPVNELTIEGIDIKVIKSDYSNSMSHLRRKIAFIEFSIKASLLCRRTKADIVFATSTPLTIAIPALIAKRKHNIPMVFEVRDLWPEIPIAIGALRSRTLKWLARWLEKTAYKNSDQIIALSPGMKEGIVRCGIERNKITTIPNGCDSNFFNVTSGEIGSILDNFDQISGKKIVLYAGTFGLINGLDYLIKVASQIKTMNSEVVFVLAGDGREASKLHSLAAKLGVINKNVFFVGQLPKNEIYQIFNKATVSVSTCLPLKELENNSANKFFDSFAAGKPVMINYGGWQKEILEKTGAGICVDCNDPEKGAQKLNEFISDEKALARARMSSKRMADRAFNRDRLVGRLEKIIKSTIEQSK